MRLTLRTMLCYLDDVLDTADAKELGAKIEESEYATNVVHRVRTSMRRLRLGAPAVSGKEMGFDPNTVADYLDNTLAPEQVADFERECLDLESEVYLAEVAACHQILTLVLGEPAEVPLSTRHRIYGLAQLDEQQLASAATALEEPAESTMATTSGDAMRRVDLAEAGTQPEASSESNGQKVETAKSTREKPEIPEYLRKGGSQRTWPMALAVLLLVILLGGIAVTMWPPGGNQGNGVAQNNPADQDEPEVDSPAPISDTDGEEPTADGIAEPPVDVPVDVEETSDGAAIDGTHLPVTDENPEVDSGLPKTPTGNNMAETDVGPISPVAGGGEATDVVNDPEGGAVARIDPPIEADASGGTSDPVLPPVDKVTAHYISAAQVMVGWDNELSTWKRLPPRAQLKPGDQIRSLPTYRPQVLLTNDIQITFSDECVAAIGNPVEDHPSLLLTSGRTVIATMGKAGNGIVVRAGGRNILLTMVDSEAAIALSVLPFQLPGDDPEKILSHVRITAIVTGGQVQWQQAGTEAVLLDYGQQISILDEGMPKITNTDSPPRWVRTNDISDIDRLASATLEPMLNDERPIEITLAERVEHPRVEVRSLAARSLASMDKFDALVDTFGDETLKSYWSEHFDRLQNAMARDAKTAALVREAVERHAGEDAERVYRLLQGYNPEQLKSGSGKQLVDYLKHDSLRVRVLAINNLRRITSRTFGYHPHLPEARRRTPVREWEQAASGGTIVYLNPPADLPPRKPAS